MSIFEISGVGTDAIPFDARFLRSVTDLVLFCNVVGCGDKGGSELVNREKC